MKLNDSDIVVSGISGRFPSSNNIQEFSENLYNKIDMTDDDESRWNHIYDDVPKRFGKVQNLEKFDASFFSILNRHANYTDPQLRMLLEHSYEAILDAGISPQSLIGSKTGVFIGCSNSESKDVFAHQMPAKDGYALMGNASFCLSNRISYTLGLCGPSLTLDTACSSSAYALDCAFHYIESGVCDAALVGGSTLILNCAIASEYSKLGILAKDGISRPFDENASGFVRADSTCVALLQKRKDCKRIYANIIYSSSNNDGFKQEGVSFPSRVMQQKLIEDFYQTINFNPQNVNFVEAHSTGTQLGDPEEVAAIDAVFCKNRSNELIVGSVKSNMGHAEAASGMASLAKIILTFENGKFPPNINLKTPRADVPSLAEKRIRVATDVENFDSDFVAMNSFGLGGANAHSLFMVNAKEKENDGIPCDDFGRMVFWSGRTEEAINTIFDDITKRALDAEYIALLQNSQILTPNANTYRGYGMFVHDRSEEKAVCVKRNIQYFNGIRRPIVFVYSGVGSQWLGMGRDLMKIPVLKRSLDECHDILLTKGIDLKKIITSTDESTFDSVMNSYIGIVTIEIALTNALKDLGVVPDFIIGHSVGELCCAYADNCFTLEETILAAHARGESCNQYKVNAGGMAAIGMHHIKLEEILPADIDIACHNGEDSTTISGPIDSVNKFVEQLKEDKIFAKHVECSGIPLHSRYISEIGQQLNIILKSIIQNPKKRSEKWLSSTYPSESWNQEDAIYSSAEYHTKNLTNPVYFQEVTEMLPKDSLIIEIAPHGLLKSILKRNLKDGIHFSLTQKNSKDGIEFFMESLGSLFQAGVDMDISKLYPPINFPVSRKTPMISPLIKWNHSEDRFVPYVDSCCVFERRNIVINISDKKYEFIQGHVVDGKVLFPAAGWIVHVWELFSSMLGVHFEKNKVILEDVHLLRATSLIKNQDIIVTISIHRGTGRFEIIEGNSPIMHGFIKQVDEIQMTQIPALSNADSIMLNENEVYRQMRLSGFYYKSNFRGIKELRSDGLGGKLKWLNNWTTFLDGITHIGVRFGITRDLAIPVSIRKIVINPEIHLEILENKLKEQTNTNDSSAGENNTEILFDIEVSKRLSVYKAGGFELHGIKNQIVSRRLPKPALYEANKFIPYESKQKYGIDDATKILSQIVIENMFQLKCSAVEVDRGDEKKPLCEFLCRAFEDFPQVSLNISYLTSSEDLQLKNVTVSNEELSNFNRIDLVIKSDCIEDGEFLEAVKTVLNENGYLISRESKEHSVVPEGIQVVAMLHSDTNEILYLLRVNAISSKFNPENVIEITENIEEWLDPLKHSLKDGPTIIFEISNKSSGILGFYNCLRIEYPEKLKCFLIIDTENAPKHFDMNDDFFKSQFDLNLAVNIFKDGKWGSYRHLNLPTKNSVESHERHCFVDCKVKGDLSTLTWVDGFLDTRDTNKDIIKIQYASLNFKDVVLALGRIATDPLIAIRQYSTLGFEFSGVDRNGERVMGIALRAGGLATHYNKNEAICWKVPQNWSLEEAATVPLVYFTVYFAFFNTCTIKPGKKILIHSGSGGVGQAAIEVALAYGLEVFTTVGTEKKKNFLLQRFPKLNPKNIGNSRDVSFEKMVIENTDGDGVDYVLNSLTDEKLPASIRCLGRDGILLEIGKYDIMRGVKLDISYLMKRITLRAVNFDDCQPQSGEMELVYKLLEEDLAKGVIKPLSTTIFNADKIEEAFRFMAGGKHIGKILIKVRENESDVKSLPLTTQCRISFESSESVIIAGGLGGFGLELAEHLVLRGCRNLVLSSANGVTSSYQKMKIETMKFLGAEVHVSLVDITTEEGCENLMKEAQKLGRVVAIFNLAGVLRDGILENLDIKMFNESMAPKAVATKYLDKTSRVLCPHLRHFVVFSSISCGRGNAGQCNYGMANSVMERIIEDRQKAGLAGKAIQWGAIGDVGMIADSISLNPDQDVGGTLLQSITSCIDSLDLLITSRDPIVSSMIVADKQAKDVRKGNVIDIILNIMGINDKKSVAMDSTLTQLGIDSLMGVEILQILEREFDITLKAQELRSLTLSQIEKRVLSKNSKDSGKDDESQSSIEDLVDIDRLDDVSEMIIKVNDKEGGNLKVLILPAIYGFATNNLRNIGMEMEFPAYILQHANIPDCETIEEMTQFVGPLIRELFSDVDKFILIGHSFGTMFNLKIAKLLEDWGKSGHVVQLDGSFMFVNNLNTTFLQKNLNDRTYFNMILFGYYKNFVDPNTIKFALKTHIDWESRIEELLKVCANRIPVKFQGCFNRILEVIENRSHIIENTDNDMFSPLKLSKVLLIRTLKSLFKDVPKDYGLSKYSLNEVQIKFIDSEHFKILSNPELPVHIKNFIE